MKLETMASVLQALSLPSLGMATRVDILQRCGVEKPVAQYFLKSDLPKTLARNVSDTIRDEGPPSRRAHDSENTWSNIQHMIRNDSVTRALVNICTAVETATPEMECIKNGTYADGTILRKIEVCCHIAKRPVSRRQFHAFAEIIGINLPATPSKKLCIDDPLLNPPSHPRNEWIQCLSIFTGYSFRIPSDDEWQCGTFSYVEGSIKDGGLRVFERDKSSVPEEIDPNHVSELVLHKNPDGTSGEVFFPAKRKYFKHADALEKLKDCYMFRLVR